MENNQQNEKNNITAFDTQTEIFVNIAGSMYAVTQ